MLVPFSYMKKEYNKELMRFFSLQTVDNLYSLLKVNPLQSNPVILYKEFIIPKKSGKKRVIESPSNELKKIQKRLNWYLSGIYSRYRHPCNFGMVKFQENPLVESAKRHVGKQYLYSIDIADFYPSIKRELVKNIFLRAPFHFSEELAEHLTFLTTYKGHLPTGAPTSPTLSNLLLYTIDEEIKSLSDELGITYTRYADDLSFSSDKQMVWTTFQNKLFALLLSRSFTINWKKTRFKKHTQRQGVTGLIVNEKVNIDRRYIRKLRAINHSLKNDSPLLAASKYYKKENATLADYHRMLLSVKAKEGFVNTIKNLAN